MNKTSKKIKKSESKFRIVSINLYLDTRPRTCYYSACASNIGSSSPSQSVNPGEFNLFSLWTQIDDLLLGWPAQNLGILVNFTMIWFPTK